MSSKAELMPADALRRESTAEPNSSVHLLVGQQDLVVEPVDPFQCRIGSDSAALLAGANWYRFAEGADRIVYPLPEGALAGARYLYTRMLLDDDKSVTFVYEFRDKSGVASHVYFYCVPRCEFFFRFPLSLLDMERVNVPREGGRGSLWIHGPILDPADIVEVCLTRKKKGELQQRFCVTPLTITSAEVPEMIAPSLPYGPVLDDLGQYRLSEWPGKTASGADLSASLRVQSEQSIHKVWPRSYSRYGGHLARKIDGSGYFRTHHDGKRWWLVDPDGYLFFSVGPNNWSPVVDSPVDNLEHAYQQLPENGGTEVSAQSIYSGLAAAGRLFPQTFTTSLHFHPDPKHVDYRDILPDRRRTNMVNFLAANLAKGFGSEEWKRQWEVIAAAGLREIGFNTVANWSDWQAAQKCQVPFVRSLDFSESLATPTVYLHFPDVYHPRFAEDVARVAGRLAETKDSPLLIGYFIDNEPKWLPPSYPPAQGMLLSSVKCHSRVELAQFLRRKYDSNTALQAAWQADISFDDVADGRWVWALSAQAVSDLQDFSGVMLRELLSVFDRECKKVDPNHLNLGIRVWRQHLPEWFTDNLCGVDVHSLNVYDRELEVEVVNAISKKIGVPVLVGEFHFGALDAGLPLGGIVTLHTQRERAQAYQTYVENAAACPSCVGVHWYTMYDQSALGRLDGENFNIGFFDVCHSLYKDIATAARETHERIYEIADGRTKPTQARPPMFR